MSAVFGDLKLLVLQPTPFCNLDCNYCYLPGRDSKHRMSMPVLDEIARSVFGHFPLSRELGVVWHAGEPTVLSVDYYRQAFELIESHRPPDVTIVHSFQTNGTLLDEEWCQFIAEKKMRVGLSIDGPRDLHDLHRRTRKGTGTYAQSMRGLERLQAHDIPFHVITVLTRESLQRPSELFAFYLQHGIRRVGFNVEEIEGSNQQSTLDFSAVDAEMRRFLGQFIALMQEHVDAVSVREFDDTMRAILAGGDFFLENSQSQAGAILSVDWQGRFCTFSPELLGMTHPRYGDFAMGALANRPVRGARRNPGPREDASPQHFLHDVEGYLAVAGDIEAGVRRCRAECEYFTLCGGGAPANKLFENGTFASTETLHCRLSKKAVIDGVLGLVDTKLRTRANPHVATCNETPLARGEERTNGGAL